MEHAGRGSGCSRGGGGPAEEVASPSLFCQPEAAEPQTVTNWVKEAVFGVTVNAASEGAPILSDEHPVMRELLKGPFPKGAPVPSLAVMPGSLTPSDCPCRREATGTFRERQIIMMMGFNSSRQSHQ